MCHFTFFYVKIYLTAVFRIRDILVWIRMQILGSVPFTNESGSGFCSFDSDLQEANNAYSFLIVYTFTSFFKVKVIKKSENSRNQGTNKLRSRPKNIRV